MATVALPIARRATRLSLPLVGAFTVGAIAYGGLYTFPAISVAFAEEFGISRTLAVTPWTMFLVVTAVAVRVVEELDHPVPPAETVPCRGIARPALHTEAPVLTCPARTRGVT